MNALRQRWHKSTVGRSLRVLSKADQRKVKLVAILQICMSALDLLGVLAIGLLGALSVTGLQSQSPGDRAGAALRVLNLAHFTFQTQAVILAVSAILLLIGRTVLSIFFTRRILLFLSHRGAKISSNLIARLLSQPLLIVQARTTQETLYAVTRGVELIVLQVIATVVALTSDLSLLLVMGIGLLLVDPTTAIGTFAVFSLIGYFLYRLMHVRAGVLGVKSS